MKRNILFATFMLSALCGWAQQEVRPFKGYFFNKEYNVYLSINLHDEDVNVPDHEILGPLPGYLGKRYNSFYWLITGKKIKSKKTATINMINDYGSEDLEATLTVKNDSTLVLEQGSGSSLKVADKGKWKKLPKTLEFIKRGK